MVGSFEHLTYTL